MIFMLANFIFNTISYQLAVIESLRSPLSLDTTHFIVRIQASLSCLNFLLY
jgi:hypothetical protein